MRRFTATLDEHLKAILDLLSNLLVDSQVPPDELMKAMHILIPT